MEDGEQKQTKGALKHLEHCYSESVFEKSAIHIREGGGSERQSFYGYIPVSALDKNVTLYQKRIGRNLFQKLTLVEGERIFQIVANKKKAFRR